LNKYFKTHKFTGLHRTEKKNDSCDNQ